MKWGLAALLLITGPALADIRISWDAPVENEDGTPLTDLAGYRLFASYDAGGPYFQIARIDDPSVLQYTWRDNGPCPYHIVATAFNEKGIESRLSAEVEVDGGDGPCVLPVAPRGLTVSATALTVYAVEESTNFLSLIPVGTVPVGTECDESQVINGYYVVPRSAVTWNGTVRALVVVARCDGS